MEDIKFPQGNSGNGEKKPHIKYHKRRPHHHKNGVPPSDVQNNTVNQNNGEESTTNTSQIQNKNNKHEFHKRKRRDNHHRQKDFNKTSIPTDTITSESDNVADDFTNVHSSEVILTTNGESQFDELINSTDSTSEISEFVEEITDKDETASQIFHEIIGVRFKTGGKIYYFATGDIKVSKGDSVIVDTSRGLEFGICEIPNKNLSERELIMPLRSVVRVATAEDLKIHEENIEREKEALAICSEKIIEHNLGMKLIDVEYAFDGSKLLFYFTAEGRVDFRELVKDLASIFRTRIELRQIGIRDETKLLGGIGVCGRPFCCKSFLSDFVQVSIKMAKEQNLSLNSQKISGACGRLMCCLRYEYDAYQEEIKKCPKVDQIVSTPDGDGTVIEVQPLSGLIRVRFGTKAEMLTPKVYHRDDVVVIGGKGVKPKTEDEIEE